jgi:hypothetical protein
MTKILFTDDSGTEMSAFINTSDNAVIIIGSKEDSQFYVFDNADEIDELINVLQVIKESL